MSKVLWAYAISVVIAGGLVVAQNVWDLNKGEWASWAQAIGTVGAIAGTYWVGERQAAHAIEIAELSAKRERARRQETYVAIVQYATLDFKDDRDDLFSAHGLLEPDLIDDAINALRAIPLVDLPNEEAISSLTTIIDRLRFMRKFSEKLPPPGDRLPKAAKEKAEDVYSDDELRTLRLVARCTAGALWAKDRFIKTFDQ